MKKAFFVALLAICLFGTFGTMTMVANTIQYQRDNDCAVFSGWGEGETSCEVYGAPGYVATVSSKIISGDGNGTLYGGVKLNKQNGTGSQIKVYLQLRDSNGCVIETQPAYVGNGFAGASVRFNTKGKSGEVFYVTINSASCQ